jgi:hypothetical protein
MCEKAKEIQDIGRGKQDEDEHEFYCCLEHKSILVYDDGYRYCEEVGCGQHKAIWLPRQDQLQAMIPGYTFIDLVQCIWDEFAEYDGDGSIFATPEDLKNITSMEQLWLAFVEHELYQKTWNGEDWQAIDLNVTRVR